MSLKHTVVALVEKGVANNADAMLPHCHGHTRQQIIIALRNAAQVGLVHCVGRAHAQSRGQRPGIYAAGPRPASLTPVKPASKAEPLPANSVFQMGDRS